MIFDRFFVSCVGIAVFVVSRSRAQQYVVWQWIFADEKKRSSGLELIGVGERGRGGRRVIKKMEKGGQGGGGRGSDVSERGGAGGKGAGVEKAETGSLRVRCAKPPCNAL